MCGECVGDWLVCEVLVVLVVEYDYGVVDGFCWWMN